MRCIKQLVRGGGPWMVDTVGVNCQKGTTTDIKARVPNIWAKG